MEKKLYRSNDRVFAGVCAGLAEYFDFDVTAVRAAYALLTFFCIAIGVAFAFLLDAWISGQMQPLENLTAAPETSGMVIQLLAAFIGTVAFAVCC